MNLINSMEKINKYRVDKVFRTPENYMEDATQSILSRIDTAGQGEKREARGVREIIRPYLMLAAAMVALVIVTYTTLRLILPGFAAGEVSFGDDEITLYLSEMSDEKLLIEAIEYEEHSSQSNSISQELSDEEIIEYLMDQNLSLETIEYYNQ